MARIRSFHQGFLNDETIVELPAQTQIFLIGLWTECDDQGVFEWKPVRLKMRLFPVANVDIAALLGELVRANAVKRIEVDGVSYGLVRNFRKYQRPKRPTAWYPLPDEFRKYVGLKPEDKAAKPANSIDDSGNDDDIGEVDSSIHPPEAHEDFGNVASLSEANSPNGPPSPPPVSGKPFQMEEGEESRGDSEAKASGAKAPDADPASKLWRDGVDWLRRVTGKPDGKCRSLIGKWRKDLGDADLLSLLAQAQAESIQVPEEWFAAVIRERKKNPRGDDPPPRTAAEVITQREADPRWAGVL